MWPGNTGDPEDVAWGPALRESMAMSYCQTKKFICSDRDVSDVPFA